MLTQVNGFGPFQWTFIASFWLMVLPASFQVLIMYFLALQPGWRCATNSTTCTSNATFDSSNTFRCSIPRDDWEYTKPTHYSIVTHFDIYCDTEWLLDLSTGIFFVGAGFGGLILGKVADTYGRKHVLFMSIGCLILIGLVSAFAPNIYVFITMRCLSGVFYSGTLGQMMVMAVELVSPNRRPFAANSVWLFYSLALCIVALKAYFIENWKIVLISCTAPYFVVILFYKQVPESVRWLALKGETDKINDIWKTIAKKNKRTLNLHMSCTSTDCEKSSSVSSFANLFRTLSLGVTTVIQAYVWLITSMVYYGLSLTAEELGGSIYRNFALVSIMECPGHIAGAFLSNRFGRKKTAMIPMFCAAITCASIPFIPTTHSLRFVRVVFGMFGKFFITTCYSCIYLWSAEIFPTSDRAKGIGLMQVFEMVGASCAPFVVMRMLSINMTAPFVFLGACGALASVLMVFLPETKWKQLA